MLYERKIRYLDYYRKGERFKNGGFAKTEVRDDWFRLEITLKGINCPDTDSADVLLYNDEREIILGKIAVKNGSGEFYYNASLKNGMAGTELSYNEISGIRIPLGGETEVSCRWQGNGEKMRNGITKMAVAEQPVEKPEEIESAKKRDMTAGEDKTTAEKRNLKAEESKTTEESWITEENMAGKQQYTDDDTKYQMQQEDSEMRVWQENKNTEQQERQKTVVLLEDKWLQLLSIYPHIKPFRDERDYLSIGPADFVLFAADSYRAANNSFLLHGYYNYRHLILTRVENRGEILYYVGVPGNYYDREKQVAIMFGFESFECESEPAQNGDFGYYMMRVKL